MHYTEEELQRAERNYRAWQRWSALLLAVILLVLLLWSWAMTSDLSFGIPLPPNPIS